MMSTFIACLLLGACVGRRTGARRREGASTVRTWRLPNQIMVPPSALRSCCRRLAGSAMNVMLELTDEELLLRDHVLDQVADGEHALHAILVYYGKMADALLRHERHAVFVGLRQGNEDDLPGHDFAHRRIA